MITVIDYGVGNLFSLKCSLDYLGFESKLVSDADSLHNVTRIILPGVGAFGDAAMALRASGMVPAIVDAVVRGAPLLGICVGMQLLFEEGFEFGRHEGLGLLEGGIYPMSEDLEALRLNCKIPQIGWNALNISYPDSPLMANTGEGEFMYFVHSYYAKCPEDIIIAEVNYGVRVPAVVGCGNVFGTQFHPEKSGDAGLRLLRMFCEM